METNSENTVMNESPIREIAAELKRMNAIREVEMLCRLSEAARGAAKSSYGDSQVEMWEIGIKAALEAYRRAKSMTGL